MRTNWGSPSKSVCIQMFSTADLHMLCCKIKLVALQLNWTSLACTWGEYMACNTDAKQIVTNDCRLGTTAAHYKTIGATNHAVIQVQRIVCRCRLDKGEKMASPPRLKRLGGWPTKGHASNEWTRDCFFLNAFLPFHLFFPFFASKLGKRGKPWKKVKKPLSTSSSRAKHWFAGRTIQPIRSNSLQDIT